MSPVTGEGFELEWICMSACDTLEEQKNMQISGRV